MPTYRLDLAYDGSGFRGYASQVGQRTVQGELESALKTVLDTEVQTSVAGRTDAGVHARGQVVSFVSDDAVDVERLGKSLNGLVGPEISIHSVRAVEDGFSARFSARWRLYRYLLDPGSAPDPLTRHFVWHVGRELDLAAMKVVAAALIGEHDFSSFCRSVEGKSNVRRVEAANLAEREGLYEFWIKANAFCHQMVRSIVGHMFDVGRGYSRTSIEEVIESRDRSAIATVAPPHGLTLWDVGYAQVTQAR